VFVGWGHKAEKANPIAEQDLAAYFDQKYEQFIGGGGAEAAKRALAKQTAEMQGKWAASGIGGRPPGPPLAAPPSTVAGAVLGGFPGTLTPQQQAQAQQAQQQPSNLK